MEVGHIVKEDTNCPALEANCSALEANHYAEEIVISALLLIKIFSC
jgi:hypothetical protein